MFSIAVFPAGLFSMSKSIFYENVDQYLWYLQLLIMKSSDIKIALKRTFNK